MVFATEELLLSAVFVGVLVCVLAMIALKLACSSSSTARDELFASGSIYPYTRVASLRLSVLMPWRSSPNFVGCHRSARGLLFLARSGAVLAAISLVLFIAFGLSRVAA